MTTAAATSALAAAVTAIADGSVTPPATQFGRGQSLADGVLGIALLHIERARRGDGTWDTVRSWLQCAAREPIAATPAASLFLGAPALAFVLHAAGDQRCYQRARTAADSAVTALTHRRVDAAMARIEDGHPASFREFDIISGLTGIGAHLLHHVPGSPALPRILAYLVRLACTPTISREPGWFVDHAPDLSRNGGHANLGMAHGVAGPLALLALAYRAGIRIDRHLEAIDRIWCWYETWRRDAPAGPWWPQWLSPEEIHTGRVGRPGPRRPSWCYGTPGITRALQLGAMALADRSRQQLAEQALAACLRDPHQLARVTDPGLCHGIAGVHQTVLRAAHDAIDPDLTTLIPTDRLTQTAIEAFTEPGFLDGAAGLALACLTNSESGWDTCLLIG